MLGSKISKYINSAIDVSDGFYGDLQKMLNDKLGAMIFKDSIPISSILKKILKNNYKSIKFSDVLSWGDDYELIFTSFKKNRKKLLSHARKNKVKISLVGTIIKKNGIFDDSLKLIKNIGSFDHFC